ncbi:CBP4-domain-containing protein [Blastocladiella britannica]|nr:CBP4-domain-containing protein [Blastocladiella britannica]
MSSTTNKIVQSVVWGGGLIGLGVLLLKYTVPTEESLRKDLSPELQRKALDFESDARRAETARILAIIKQNAESDRPVWDVRGFEPPTAAPSSAPAAEESSRKV